jgi:hypothetical protein
MSRAALGNLMLLLVAGVLGFAVWQTQQSDKPERLTNLSIEEIRQIDISDLSGRFIRLHKRGDLWQINELPADAGRIDQLLKICATPSLLSFEAPGDLAPFGLEVPKIVLKLNDEPLAFGNTDPVNGWRYVGYAGNVHLIADGFYHHLSAPAEAWVERD